MNLRLGYAKHPRHAPLGGFATLHLSVYEPNESYVKMPKTTVLLLEIDPKLNRPLLIHRNHAILPNSRRALSGYIRIRSYSDRGEGEFLFAPNSIISFASADCTRMRPDQEIYTHQLFLPINVYGI